LRYARPPSPQTPASIVDYPWSREICTLSQLLLSFKPRDKTIKDKSNNFFEVQMTNSIWDRTSWNIFIWINIYRGPILSSFIIYLEWVHRKTSPSQKSTQIYQTSQFLTTTPIARWAIKSSMPKRRIQSPSLITMSTRRQRCSYLMTK